MDSGSPPPPLESLSKTLAPTLLTPNVTTVRILVTTGSPAPCTPVPLVGKPRRVTLHIIVWRPNVISVTDGDTLTRYATFGSVEDATPPGTWSITVQSTRLSNQKFVTPMGGLTLTTTTSIPLWMITKEMVCVEPGARVYEGGNVTISFLSHVFFLISVVRRPHFSFAPSYEEIDQYLLAFPTYSSSLLFPL